MLYVCFVYFLICLVPSFSYFAKRGSRPTAGNSAAESLTNGRWRTMESVARLHCVRLAYPLEQQSIAKKEEEEKKQQQKVSGRLELSYPTLCRINKLASLVATLV